MTATFSIDFPTSLKPSRQGPKRRRKQHLALDKAVSHLMAFLDRVGIWMTANDDRLKKVYLVPEGSSFFLYVIAKSTARDFELTKSLCDLMIELSGTGFDAFGSQIPDGTPDELAAFLDTSKALVLARR
jgi:hypothetical protein